MRQGPVQLGAQAHAALRPVPDATITGGFWARRRQVNAAVSIPAGAGFLESAGNLGNLRLAAGLADGQYRGDLPFLDSDVYKWLEAAAWLLADGEAGAGGGDIAARRDEIIALLGGAQRPDGYLQSWFQVARPQPPYTDLQWGHELYCAGHLIQAAVAHARGTGRDDLLRIACRLADHIDAALGPGGRAGVDGHPEIETALTELYRCTGEPRYLRLAGHLLDQRGRGLLGDGRFGRAYWQDHTPLRQADAVAGHAVRQLYLLAGAADVYLENGDPDLLAAVVRLWEDMAGSRAYLTGGVGSHHTDESFGDPYELPPERAYCETCAAIASIMASWRLLLITGEARYADLAERTLYNGFLAGVSLDGRGYLYVNPLQVRAGSAGAAGDQKAQRRPWFRCACCPPNIMRLLASLQHYLAAAGPDGLWLCQYATGTFAAAAGEVEVTTGYPWQGRVTVRVTASGPQPWSLHLRIPGWCAGPRIMVNGQPSPARPADGWARLQRQWEPGDVVELGLPIPARLTAGHPRADAVRGCVAIERGPLVYCLEQADQPAWARLDDVAISPGAPLDAAERPGLLGGVTTVTVPGHRRQPGPGGNGAGWWPYRPAGQQDGDRWEETTLTAIPYFAWANREPGAMRVWIAVRGPR
ncbi:MAG: glycoside hydrolase family 127 protein [Gemmatimonadota bacterium]